MIRPSKHFVIKDNDIKEGFVIKKRYKDLDEYWVYRNTKSSSLVNVMCKPLEIEEKYLFAIISCGNNHITLRNEEKKFVEIEGMRFTDDLESNDLDDYLRKTNRSRNG